MVPKSQVDEIVQDLMALPPDKIVVVKDFVQFLKSQYGQSGAVDESDNWSEEDLRDFSAASANYREKIAPWDDSPLDGQENFNGEKH